MFEQIGIALFGLTAIWLSQDSKESLRKWGPIFGMLSQPFWYYSAFKAQQWGILFLSIFYTLAWAKGIKTYWMTNESE